MDKNEHWREKIRKGFPVISLVFAILLVFITNPVSASPLTQGEYAIQLAERLGLGENLTVEAAIAALGNVQIVPQGGWRPEEEVTQEFLEEILALTVEAARRGLISLSPEEAANAVNNLSRELGFISPPSPPPPPPPPPVPPASPSS